MQTLDLARWQFALTAGFHFLFVTLTLGLAPLVAIIETRYALSGRPVLDRMARFWGHIYVINYALGIVVGLVLEFQFGLNWSGLSRMIGEVFGVPLAIETLVAFFLESTFLGMWIFGWRRLPAWLHATLFWLVTITGYASAYWIMVANGFLQHPVGYLATGGGAQLTRLGALLTNPGAIFAFLHIVPAALLTGGFFVAGVSAWHLFRRTGDREFFRRSLRLGLVSGTVAAVATVGFGYGQIAFLNPWQPMKLAVANGRTAEVARLQAEMVARFGPGDYRPPSWIGGPWTLMQAVGFAYFLAGLACCLLLVRNILDRARVLLLPLMLALPVPFLTVLAGWLLREEGRQPWAVYGVLRVSDAVSHTSRATMLASLAAFTAVFAVLAIVDYLLIARVAVRGPGAPALGATLGTAEDDPLGLSGSAATGPQRTPSPASTGRPS